jgi:hypothetical protein
MPISMSGIGCKADLLAYSPERLLIAALAITVHCGAVGWEPSTASVSDNFERIACLLDASLFLYVVVRFSKSRTFDLL